MSQATAADLPREGDIIAEKYRVERVLGAGGMGVVVSAQHVRLDEKVALKFLLPSATMNAEVIARFEREARAASKIKNEHVARVTDVGTLPNGSPYMVMEYLQGSDLAAWLEQRGPLPVDMAVDFILQACEAIGEAHSIGIVHRDLKPANLFCTQRTDGQLFIKVLDFGISKLTTPGADSHMTRTTAFLGSPLYMSPEQMQTSKGVDARTDIWSLGVILFELISGKAPFDAESVTELAIKIAIEPPTMLRSLRGDAPAGLEAVVAKCLEKDRAKRFQSVADLAVALGDFAPPHARLSVERVVGTQQRAGMITTAGASRASSASLPQVTTSAAGPATAASWGQTGETPVPSRGKGLAIGLGAVTLVMLLGGAAILYRSTTSPTAVVASATSAPATSAPPAATPEPSTPPVAAAPPPTAAHEEAPAASSAPATSAVPVAPAAPAAHTPAAHTAHPAAPAAKAGAANCKPPYTIGANGQHVYKPECL